MATKRGSSAIGPKQTARAFHAVRFANDNASALNLLVTINFTMLGINPDDATGVFQDIWSRVSRWWAYQRSKGRRVGTFDCYAVHEHPEQRSRHVHWFIRAPGEARAEVERVIRSRVEKVTGYACLGRAIHFLDVAHPGGVVKYTLKGVDPAFADHFHVDASDQGVIVGRRIAVSRSIGYAARQRAGWRRTKRPRPLPLP